MDKDDYVIICGDAACAWDDGKESRYWLKWLSDKPFTTLYVDGNHENFDMLNALPTEIWRGGKAHHVAPSVVHLMRGQVYAVAGKTLFTFGGARSHDIQDGVLDPDDPDFRLKRKKLRRAGARYRINHVSWWKEELPSEAEYAEGIRNLDAQQWKVDFIVSHTGPASAVAAVSDVGTGRLEQYLEDIKQRCCFDKWFFGHYHQDIVINSKEHLLYRQLIRIC